MMSWCDFWTARFWDADRKLIMTEMLVCPPALKVIVGLASHWPCVTDSVVYPPTDSTATTERWAFRLRSGGAWFAISLPSAVFQTRGPATVNARLPTVETWKSDKSRGTSWRDWCQQSIMSVGQQIGNKNKWIKVSRRTSVKNFVRQYSDFVLDPLGATPGGHSLRPVKNRGGSIVKGVNLFPNFYWAIYTLNKTPLVFCCTTRRGGENAKKERDKA